MFLRKNIMDLQMMEPNTVSMSEGDDEDLRLLLIGKTGSGKSATGNVIFNDRVFESEMSPSSVTRSCQTHTGAVNNRSVRVIDTPDFIFSTHTDFDSDSELKRALELCSAGAHVILLLLSLSTFTEQEMSFTDWFEKKFGADALRFTVVLFTRTDQGHTKTLAEMISMNPQLSAFINRCGRRFLEFNIKAPADRGQVTELMEKINILVSENSNSCYTLDMMQETERRREEEREREHRMILERDRRETETRVRGECEAGKSQKDPIHKQLKQKWVSITISFAVESGGVLVLNIDCSFGCMFIKGNFTGGSVLTAGVFTVILWRLMLKRQFMCSSSQRPCAVRQILEKTAGVLSAGAVIGNLLRGNELLVTLLAGLAAAARAAITLIQWKH